MPSSTDARDGLANQLATRMLCHSQMLSGVQVPQQQVSAARFPDRSSGSTNYMRVPGMVLSNHIMCGSPDG